MNEMYAMSLSIHSFGLAVFAFLVLGNLALLAKHDDPHLYARRMRVLMPVSTSLIFLILFTGAVMMAAKHLSFTLPNIAMILFSLVLIMFEARRYGRLKHMDINLPDAFSRYKAKATRWLWIELAGLILISVWMFLL